MKWLSQREGKLLPDAKKVKEKIKITRKPFFNGDPESGRGMRLPYGGRRIPVTIIDGIGGYYKEGYCAHDALCRADDGQYFLAREVAKDRAEFLNCWMQRMAFRLPSPGYWLRVKRLSLRAALAYAIRGCAPDLFRDTLDAMQLDTHASALLARFIRKTGTNPRDAVNAAVVCILESALNDKSMCFGDAMKGAAERREAA